MQISRALRLPVHVAIVLLLVMTGVATWVHSVQAQSQSNSHAQIATNSPLPVYVTNLEGRLPDGFVAGSNWRFTTWTVPTVLTWTATVNRTSGAWAYLTITGDDRITTRRWYYVPAMPGSWERQ
jgi:hypothetical protein